MAREAELRKADQKYIRMCKEAKKNFKEFVDSFAKMEFGASAQKIVKTAIDDINNWIDNNPAPDMQLLEHKREVHS
jgi:protein associated with RNAse G/E